MLRAICRAIVVLPVPWAPPISISSPARRPRPIVLAGGVKPSGTGWYSARCPVVTRSLRSPRTSSAERGVMLPCSVSRCQPAVSDGTKVASVLVVTRWCPPRRHGSLARFGRRSVHQCEGDSPTRKCYCGVLPCRARDLVEGRHDRADGAFVVGQRHPFVGRVGVLARLREAQEDDRQAQGRLEAG